MNRVQVYHFFRQPALLRHRHPPFPPQGHLHGEQSAKKWEENLSGLKMEVNVQTMWMNTKGESVELLHAQSHHFGDMLLMIILLLSLEKEFLLCNKCPKELSVAGHELTHSNSIATYVLNK